MKDRILIKDLHEHIGKNVKIAGSVETRRDHGKIAFIDLHDRSGTVQMVVLPSNADAYESVGELRSEFVVRIEGIVNQRPEKMVNSEQKNGDIEIEVKKIEVLGRAEEMPFEKDGELNLDTYLDYLPFTLRTPRTRAIFKVQSEIVRAYREFLRSEDFTEFQSPKLVGADAEGGAAVFKVDYLNGKDAYLSTSPQLYKQIMVGVFERVFTVGNVFRGEKHSTTRHLNEYISLDAEIGFIDSHEDVMDMLSRTLRYIEDYVSTSCIDELALLNAEQINMPDIIPVLKLREAQELIYKETGEECRKEKDLAPEHERWLSEYAKKEYDSDFIFITHFPIEKTAFYAYEDPSDVGYTRYFDLLFRGVELVSGGQRVHDVDTLRDRIKAKGLDPENFAFYLQAFKYGMPPHGGWGMGLERLTQKFLGLSNVKEATLFPREINRIDTLLSR
jgi:nondiscriminating aspartyl-tRNA synthetase